MPPVRVHQHPLKMFALALTLVSLAMGLVLLLVRVIRACRPEEEYPWNITYQELLACDEETQNHIYQRNKNHKKEIKYKIYVKGM